MKKENFITGEKFIKLANIIFCPNHNDLLCSYNIDLNENCDSEQSII